MKQVMLLAAGVGSRLRPLTDRIPKPLLAVGGEPLLLRHIRRFAAAGYQRIVINLHHLAEQIQAAAGDGSAYGVEICYSPEDTLLAAAGGIRQAIARGYLDEPFAVANGDIFCDYDVAKLPTAAAGCHLVLVDNPPQKPQGDFSLSGGQLTACGTQSYTYAGIGSYTPAMFMDLAAGEPHDLLPLLQKAIAAGTAGGEYHAGRWHDIGTPQSLAAAENQQQQ